MYSIVTVIYGIPLPDDHTWDEDECEQAGYNILYSGSAPCAVGFCGVEIDEFDECRASLCVDDMNWSPTPEQKEEGEQLVNKLPPEFRGTSKVGVYFIFSTS